MTLRKYKQSRKMRKHPRKSLKSRRVAKRRKNVRRTRRIKGGDVDDMASETPKSNLFNLNPYEYRRGAVRQDAADDTPDIPLPPDQERQMGSSPIKEEPLQIDI